VGAASTLLGLGGKSHPRPLYADRYRRYLLMERGKTSKVTLLPI
jgi:hypothetical protein